MNDFNKKNVFQLKKICLSELEKYYIELRKYEYEHNIPLKYMELRKKIHKLLLQLIKIDRILAHEELYVIGDKRIKSHEPKIYACTHIGGNDIQRTFEAIEEHAYLFLGDPREIYRDLTGVILNLNGAICMDTNDKNDRQIAYERSIELLSSNTNLLIYPEGAWNITDNLPVMKLYPGVAKMASETGADIIPVAIEQYDNRFFVNIGENIKYSLSKSNDIQFTTEYLRDILATLKWQIWEYNGIISRASVSKEFIENYKQNIVNKCEYDFTIQDVYHTMYRDKNITDPEEAYIVSPQKQFELRKKYSHE